jgi:hypothetical protein
LKVQFRMPALALLLTAAIAAPLCAAATSPPQPSPAGGLSGLVGGAFAQVWARMQSAACDKIRARLEQPGALAPGTTAYGTTCTFGGPGSVSLDTSHLAGGLLGMHYAVDGNALDFRTKSPLGHWFDPKFHVTYDLTLDAHGGSSWTAPVPHVVDATASAHNLHVHGGNVTGSFAALFINPGLNQSVDLKAAIDQSLAEAQDKNAR